ncbi:MAG: GIY-YIG nuclease family protein [Phaeodactylibacter sp.]|nr:GIY-YIG nuclease family protein [Phaeodactylibacter sp.]
MKQFLYTAFDYRFIYLGVSTRNPGRLKIGIARNVKSRWKAIDKSMKGKQFPIFSLPCFFALWFEGHLHRVMNRFNSPVKGDGGSEFYSYINPFSWLGWAYVLCCIICAFLITHLLIYGALTGLWCWWRAIDFWTFQREILDFFRFTIS